VRRSTSSDTQEEVLLLTHEEVLLLTQEEVLPLTQEEVLLLTHEEVLLLTHIMRCKYLLLTHEVFTSLCVCEKKYFFVCEKKYFFVCERKYFFLCEKTHTKYLHLFIMKGHFIMNMFIMKL